MWFLKFIRIPNLLIVALTQFLLYYLVFLPYFNSSGISPTLASFQFILFVLVTVLIAAGGYVINDVIDYKIDVVNKPHKTFINNQLSKEAALKIYQIIVGVGAVISIYLAFYVEQFPLFFIYPFAVILLYFYSKFFKQRVLIGNVVVAIFCAFVAGIVWFAERNTVAELGIQNPPNAKSLKGLLVAYLFFAFFSTIYREIIKDIEDRKGDEENGCKTLPIVFGVKTAKNVAFIFGFILFLNVLFFAFWLNFNAANYSSIFSIIGVLMPITLSFRILKNANTEKQFNLLSRLAKFIMLSGLILLIFASLEI